MQRTVPMIAPLNRGRSDVSAAKRAAGFRRHLGLAFWWYVPASIAAMALATGCSDFAARGLNAEGVRLFDQTRYQEALRQFQKAIDSDPNNADAYYNLAATYHRLGALNRRQPDLAQTENYYQFCLNRDPNHRECHRGLAVLLAEQGRSEEAFRLLQAWAERSPHLADPKIELARLCEETGDRESAKKHLADALRVDAGNARALAALGHLHEQSGNHSLALQDYQQSLYADSFQPDVAARVAALQSVVKPNLTGASPSAGTQTAAQPPNSVR